jgi:hypothetical protein
MKTALFLTSALAALSLSHTAQEFEVGDPGIRSMSVLTFHPDGVLFVGDSKGGAVYALDMDPGEPAAGKAIQMVDVEGKLAARLGTTSSEVMIHDLAVHPVSKKLFLAVSRGRSGWDSRWQTPNNVADADILVTIDGDGTIEVVDLEELSFTRIELPNPVTAGTPHGWKEGVELRSDMITDMQFVDDELFVTGLSNEEFASTLWKVPFPFDADGEGKPSITSLEIFHGAHGAYETHAPIRTFVPYELEGESHVLAAYLCTPFVTFPADDLKDGAHVKGRTVAELGSGNYPVDMVVYQRNGVDRVLITNSSLPLMIMKTEDIASFEGAITKSPETYVAGVPYESRSGTGFVQLDILNEQLLVALQRDPGGKLNLTTLPTNRY